MTWKLSHWDLPETGRVLFCRKKHFVMSVLLFSLSTCRHSFMNVDCVYKDGLKEYHGLPLPYPPVFYNISAMKKPNMHFLSTCHWTGISWRESDPDLRNMHPLGTAEWEQVQAHLLFPRWKRYIFLVIASTEVAAINNSIPGLIHKHPGRQASCVAVSQCLWQKQRPLRG